MALNFDRLTQEVAELTTTNEAVIKLLSEVAETMRNNAANQARIEALADELDQRTRALAAAVDANTAPVDPVPLPDPIQPPAWADDPQPAPVQPPVPSTGADSL